MDWIKMATGIVIALFGVLGLLRHLSIKKHDALRIAEMIGLIIMVLGGSIWVLMNLNINFT
jgi:multisubunit Na+/H+ antiporter MnhG subunit